MMAMRQYWLVLALASMSAGAQAHEATWANVGTELGVELAPVSRLFHAGGSVWVCTPDMLLEVRRDNCRPHPGVPPGIVSLVSDSEGAVWASYPYDGPLWRLMDGVWERYEGIVGHCSAPCFSGPYPDDYVIPCYGAYEEPGPPVYHGIPYVPEGWPPFLLAADADGSLWMARADDSEPRPVWRVEGGATECWGRPPLPPLGKGAQCITARPGGGVDTAFGDIDEVVIASHDGQNWSSMPAPWPTRALVYDAAGNLWASGVDLSVRVDGAWETVHQGSVFALDRLASDPTSGVWCLGDSVVHATTTQKAMYAAPPGSPQAIVVDDEGCPWVGTDAGLWRMVLPGTDVEATSWGRVKKGTPEAR